MGANTKRHYTLCHIMATDTICSSYTHGIRRIDKGNNLHVVSPQPLAHEKRLTQMEFSPKYFPLRPRSHRNCAETAPRLHCLTACPGNEFTKSCDACFAASIRVPPSASSSLIDHEASRKAKSNPRATRRARHTFCRSTHKLRAQRMKNAPTESTKLIATGASIFLCV